MASFLVMLAAQLASWTDVSSFVTGGLGALAALLIMRLMTRTAGEAVPTRGVHGAPLVAAVLLVWRRQIDRARSYSEESMSNILASFGSLSGRLDQAIQMTQVNQLSVNEMVQRNEVALEHMLESMRQAVTSHGENYAKLDMLSEAMSDLRRISLQIKQQASRTDMLASNASVEVSRAGERGSGFVAAAQEVHQLATLSGDAANKMMSRINEIDLELQELRNRASVQNSSDEALQNQAVANARMVISGLLNSLGDMNHSPRELQDAGSAVHEELERVLMNFQMQDRLSQMLCCVMEDIDRLTEWLQQGGDLSLARAGEWLARLDESYTMEEQRSEHHGNTSIQREAAIEFF